MLKNLPYVPKFNLPEIVPAMKHEDGKTYIDCSVYQATVCKCEKELKNVLIICLAEWCVLVRVLYRDVEVTDPTAQRQLTFTTLLVIIYTQADTQTWLTTSNIETNGSKCL